MEADTEALGQPALIYYYYFFYVVRNSPFPPSKERRQTMSPAIASVNGDSKHFANP